MVCRQRHQKTDITITQAIHRESSEQNFDCECVIIVVSDECTEATKGGVINP